MSLIDFLGGLAPDNIDERIDNLRKANPLLGEDPFGTNLETLRSTYKLGSLIYRYYFRCITTGKENIVADGPVIFAANHGGQLPFDSFMINTALFLESTPPRIARTLMDRSIPSIPFIGTWFTRFGTVTDTVRNAHLLLSRDEALLAFPEGEEAIRKTFQDAYRLLEFEQGFIRLALSFKAPVVPVSIVGPDEQYPTLYNIETGRNLLNTPSVPIWLQMPIPFAGLFPLPVRYYIHFGKPFLFEGDPDAEDEVVLKMANTVKEKIQQTVNRLRETRTSVFK